MVNAGLLQRFSREQCIVCRVGGAQQPNVHPKGNIFVFNMLASSRSRAVGKAVPPEDGGPGSGDLKDLSIPSLDPAILVIDQFEEIFTSYPEHWQHRAGFFNQLRDLLKSNPQLHVLFVIREDHVAELDNYTQTMPGRLRIRYHLEPLREDQTIEAIREPGKLCGFEFAEGVLESLVKDLRTVPVKTRDGTVEIVGEFVEPLHLQVVCLSLLEKLPVGHTVTHSDIHAFADVDEALGVFYNNAVSRTVATTGVSEFQVRKWFDRQIITSAGTRGIVFAAEQSVAGIPVKAAAHLEAEKVLRAEPRAGATWYELTHDRFIGPILASNRAYYEKRSRRRNAEFGAIIFVMVVGLLGYFILTQKKAGNPAAIKAETDKAQQLGYEQGHKAAVQQQRETASLVARTLARPESNAEDDPSRSLAALGLVEATLDDPKKASDYFNRAREADPMMPLLVLDKAIADAQSHNDSVLSKLKIARRDYLESFDPFEGRSPAIKRYACEHNAFVIGASDLVVNSQDELKRWRKNYPYAELGAPTPNN